MANIPTVPGSEQDIHTPERNVQLNAGALAGPRLRGAEAVAGAIEGVGDVAAGFQADMAKVRFARISADADLKMRAAQQAFIESTKGDSDEQQWQERAKSMADKVRTDIFSQNGGIPPGLRPQLNIALDSWGQGLQIQAKTMSNLQSINRAQGTLYADYQEAGRDGHADHMAAIVKLGRSSKLDPVMMDEWERNIPKIVASSAIEQGMATNPAGMTDVLEASMKYGAPLPDNVLDQNGNLISPKKVFSPQAMERLISEGRRQTNTWQAGNFNQALANYDQDPKKPLSHDQLMDMVKSKLITDRMADAYESHVNRDNVNEAKANAGYILGLINNYDRVTDTDNSQLVDIIAGTAGTPGIGSLPTAYQTKLNKELDARLSAKTPDKSDDGYTMLRDLLNDHRFGNWAVVDKKTGKDVRDQKIWQKAHERFWDLQTALSAEIAKNPDLENDREGQRKFIATQIQGQTDLDMGRATIDGMTGQSSGLSASTEAEVERISHKLLETPKFKKDEVRKQGGKTYKFDGENWNEVK
jgi:hypothetical protein